MSATPLSAALLVASALLSSACAREPSRTSTESAPTTPPAPAPTTMPACAPWKDAALLVVSSQGGRGDYFRTFEYDLATATLRVHDSDPFATGDEAATPRVIDERTTLTGDARLRTERALFALCPGADALARRCAPGGCLHLTVTHRDGTTTRVEDADTVVAAMQPLAAHFPQLRTN